MNNKNLNHRRELIKKLGAVAIFSPLLKSWVNSLPAFAQQETKKSFVFFVTGGGTMLRTNPCMGNGQNYTLSPFFSPLEKVKKDIAFIQGISNKAYIKMMGRDDGGHDSPLVGFSGSQGSLTEENGHSVINSINSPTFDSVISPYLHTNDVPFARLDFSVGAEFGGPIRRVMFWKDKQTPADQMRDPSTAFQRIFVPQASVFSNDANIVDQLKRIELDTLNEQIKYVKSVLSTEEKYLLDAQQAALSDLNTQTKTLSEKIKNLSVNSENFIKQAKDASGKVLPYQDPESYPAVMESFIKMAAFAVKSGLTRLITIQLGDPFGDRFLFPFLEKKYPKSTFPQYDFVGGNYHYHYGHDFALRKSTIELVEQWYSEQFVSLLNEFKGADNNGLKDTLLLWMNTMEHKPHHRVGLQPAILAGLTGGKLKTGQLLNLYGEATTKSDFLPEYLKNSARSTNDLFMTVASLLNVKMDSFGDKEFCSGIIKEIVS
jgi:Protein of unknown function (DUF1552)